MLFDFIHNMKVFKTPKPTYWQVVLVILVVVSCSFITIKDSQQQNVPSLENLKKSEKHFFWAKNALKQKKYDKSQRYLDLGFIELQEHLNINKADSLEIILRDSMLILQNQIYVIWWQQLKDSEENLSFEMVHQWVKKAANKDAFVLHSLPVEYPLHPRITSMITRFMTTHRRFFIAWLNRSTLYKSMIEKKLKQNNLPFRFIVFSYD